VLAGVYVLIRVYFLIR